MKSTHLAKRFNLEKNISKEVQQIEEIMHSKEPESVKMESIRAILTDLSQEIVEARTDKIYEDRTGFLGPKFGEDYLEKEIEVCKRYEKDFTIALLDIDFLKSINDRFGHVAGTKAILEVADAIKKSVRTSDVVSRYGGDEFLIIFTDTTMTNAKHSSYRIKYELDKKNIENEVKIAISFGLAQFSHKKPVDAKSLIDEADKMLYAAKKNRGNPNA
jgi:diguanylate cyclase (GGDEF)-like protein